MKSLKYLSKIFFLIFTTQFAFSQSECDYKTIRLTEAEMHQKWLQRASLLKKDDSLNFTTKNFSRNARTEANSIYELSQALYLLPIKIWLHQNSAGTQGPNILRMQQEMDRLNKYYFDSGTNIQFYISSDSPEIIKNDKYLNTSESDANYVIDNWYNEDIINVHMVNEYNGGGSGVYVNPFPLFQDEGVIISTDVRSNETILSHEVGHHLGLEHTHEGDNEPIDRNRTNFWGNKKCLTTGDGFCDTPADPDLNNKNSPSCVFVDQSAKDGWGDFYARPPAGSQSPDYQNIMSYGSPRICRNRFSANQGQYMRTEADDNKYDGDFDLRHLFVFDKHEPDNQREIARNIVYGVAQHHSFHWVAKKEEELYFNDTDWIKFTIASATSVNIVTYAAYFRNPDTEIFLYRQESNGTLTLIAQDNDSNGNKYSKILANNLTPATYYVQIKPKNAGSLLSVYDYFIEITNCTPEFASITGEYNNIEMVRLAKNTFTVGGDGKSFRLGTNGNLKVKAGQSIVISGEVVISGEFNASIDENLTCDNAKQDVIFNSNTRVAEAEDIYTSNNLDNQMQENADAIAKIFPNPLTNQEELNLEIYTPIDSYFSLNIYSVLGNKIASNLANTPIKTGYDRFKISTLDLENGIYIVIVNVGLKKFFHKLIISK